MLLLQAASVPFLVATEGATVNYNGRCSGLEASLFDCSNGNVRNAACPFSISSVGVICEISESDKTFYIIFGIWICSPLNAVKFLSLCMLHVAPVCNDNDIRLVGTDTPTQGRLEVCLYGVWGSVCDDQWTERNSEVVCRQLGYENSGKLIK